MAVGSVVLVAGAFWLTGGSDTAIAAIGSVATLAAGAVVLRAASTRTGRARAAWAAAGMGPALLAAGIVVDGMARGLPTGSPSVAVGHAVQVIGLLLIAVAAAVMPAPKLTGVGRIDAGLIVLTGLALMWLAPLRTSRGPTGGLTQVLERDPWAISAVLGILAGAALLIRGQPGRRPEMRPLVAALLAYPACVYTELVADTSSAASPASRVAQLWWLVAPVLLAGAGWRAWSMWQEPARTTARVGRVTSVLPAVAVVVTLASVAVHQRVLLGLDPVMMVIGVLTVLLAALRLNLLQDQQRRLLDDLHELAGELGDQARRDELTGLGNRLSLEEDLGTALARATDPATHPGVTAFFVDVDDFKHVNDALGHDAGDRLLVELGQRLTDVVGEGVYRIGGDEFVAVRDDLDEARAEAMAGALVASLAPPVTIEGRPVSAASSVGLARSNPRVDGDGPDRRADDADGLLRRADLALYRAKELGRSRWAAYDAWLQERADRRLELQQGLRGAIDDGGFELRFQPIVDLSTRRVLGAEALLRWDTEDHGLLLPEEFLPLAAEAGLLPEIGRLVLADAADRLRDATLPDGSPLWLAVNVSAQELAHGGIVDATAEVLARAGVAPERLHLELTERLFTDPAAAATIDELAATGVRLTVQDFGTGSSSLRRLGRFDRPTVKVDRSFVAGLGRRRGDRLILEAVAELATDLNFTLTAEGVSQEVQAAELVRLGVARAQGWLFGPAVSWDEFADAHLVAPVARAAAGGAS
jgi:diguanylate cyclase (GGDEF)-like protein